MATDGVRIIDGDLASDTYDQFMEMYDAGATVQEIRQAVEEPYDEEDGFDYEIYITVYALALWQIGQLTPYVIAEVDEVIDRGAGVKTWTEECGAKEGQKRQLELEKLRKKLSLPNLKIRKRRTYKVVTKFVFEENAVITFQLPDGDYCATILVSIMQHQGRCHYFFIVSTYKSKRKPTIEDIKNVEIVGRKKPLSFGNYGVWLATILLGPKLLRSFASQFEQIGKLEIKPEHKEIGSSGGAKSFEDFCQRWTNSERYFTQNERETFQLKELL